MKILITGISGLLAADLWKTLNQPEFETYGLSRKKPGFIPGEKWLNCDITDFAETYQKVTKLNPDIIIHTAAASNVDDCEQNPEVAFRVNSLGTRNLAIASQRFDSTLIYISTDYVFDGKEVPKNGYREFDRPSPVNIYGLSKLWGEYYVQKLLNKFCIIRTSWLFGDFRKNYITAMLDSQNEILATDEMVSSPTFTKDLAQAIKSFITHRSSLITTLYGIYHLTNGGFASRYEIAEYVAKISGIPQKNIKKIKLSELNLAAQRPPCSVMENYVWKLDGHKPLRPWQDAVKEFIYAYTKKQN